jgi:putative DNA primase/helicase
MTTANEMARGQWATLLPLFGIDATYLQNKHGPCPMCGGKDRFRWDDRRGNGNWICSGCGHGDGFDLVSRTTGMTFKDVATKVAELLGKENNYTPKPRDPEEERQREAMSYVWRNSTPISDEGPVSLYLTRRTGTVVSSTFLREHVGKCLMVAKIVGHNDCAVNLHITALTQQGFKADVTPAKRVMAGKLPDGCAIRLAPAAAIMGVAEGIETAISAALMFDMPVWACVNGTLLSKWIPPGIAEQVTVFADNDANYAGHAKAYHLANRLEVQFKRKVEVRMPPVTGSDWNDFHTTKRSGDLLRVVK